VDGPSEAKTRAYYDDFSTHYEARRGGNVPHGYHDLLDHLESDFVKKFGESRRVLEVGCGTGLILERIARFAAFAEGVDLSPGMLRHAEARGLKVREASANALPFADQSFDVTCSFKVLPHVPDLEGALQEMARVTKPGGYVIAEFYNPLSFRGLLRALGPARKIGKGHAEKDVYTRFDTPSAAAKLAPKGTRFVGARGVRILTVAAPLLDHRFMGPWLYRAECWAADTPLRNFGGFFVAAFRKE
jgi:ubiquinone/menaquinone biosynthesis C-methylase UbiE